jgi:hypothetical protein
MAAKVIAVAGGVSEELREQFETSSLPPRNATKAVLYTINRVILTALLSRFPQEIGLRAIYLRGTRVGEQEPEVVRGIEGSRCLPRAQTSLQKTTHPRADCGKQIILKLCLLEHDDKDSAVIY